MRKPPSIRSLAILSLNKWEKGHVYAESLIQHASQQHQLSPADRNLLHAILVDTIRHLRKIDFWIQQLREGKLDATTRNTLRIGLCQLHILGIPQHAAVNETVNASQKSTRGLVNAILRKSLREAESLEKETSALPSDIQFSHPEWLTTRWIKAFGKADTRTLLEWNQQPSQTIFRLNPLKNNVHHLLDEIEHITSIPHYPDFFISEGLPPKAWLEDGLIYIQDPATSHSVELLAPLPGETILDACAAPGGKSGNIAAAMQNAGQLTCTDSNPKRLPRLEENLARLGVTHASVEEWDWLNYPPERFHQKFDGILLDVPCSNTGVLRRRIDARWRLRPKDFTELQAIQLKILENALICLKPGGRIVYSTCSIDAEENQLLIKTCIAKHPKLQLVSDLQILPQTHQTDGAYAAELRLSP